MIRAIFFDYDGVLTTDATGTLTTCRYLSQRTGVSYDAFRQAFDVDALDVRVGKLTRAQTWPAVCERLGREIPLAWLFEAYESTPRNDAMFELARDLGRRYRVGIITDNPKDRFDCVSRSQRLAQLFAPIVVSGEIGQAKSDPSIFQQALALAEVEGHESVFVDNTPANLEVAQSVGMHTIHHDDAMNDVPALARELEAMLAAPSLNSGD